MALALLGLGLPAHADGQDLPAATFDWVMIEPRPAFNPGFLALPDDSDTGPVFRCASRACGASAPTCTTRIYPEKATVWNGIATPDWFADPRRGVITEFLGIDDAERISPTFRERLEHGRSGLDRSNQSALSYEAGNPLDGIENLGARDVVVARIAYAIGDERWVFLYVTWVGQNRLHQNTCTTQGDESLLKGAALDFTRDH